MILLVYYHGVIRATWNCQLSHKRGITFSILNDSIDKRRLCLLTIHHIISGRAAGQSARAREAKQPAHTHKHPQTLAVSESQGRGRLGLGGTACSSGQVTHTQQTPFTKRHLFHYFHALWLITSWPICEMTATYSPVNHKICTCSVWAVGSERRAGE